LIKEIEKERVLVPGIFCDSNSCWSGQELNNPDPCQEGRAHDVWNYMFCMAVACQNTVFNLEINEMKILVKGLQVLSFALALRLLERANTVYGIDNMNDYYESG